MEAKYIVGQPLVVKATGEIVTPSDVRAGLKSVLYTVFSDGKKVIYKEDALESYEDPDRLLLKKIENNEIMNADEFHKYYYFNMFSENQENPHNQGLKQILQR